MFIFTSNHESNHETHLLGLLPCFSHVDWQGVWETDSFHKQTDLHLAEECYLKFCLDVLNWANCCWCVRLVLIIDSLQVFHLALSSMCNENNTFFLLWEFRWIFSPKFSWYLLNVWGTCWFYKEYTKRMLATWRVEWDFSSLSLLWCFLRLHTVSTVLCL